MMASCDQTHGVSHQVSRVTGYGSVHNSGQTTCSVIVRVASRGPVEIDVRAPGPVSVSVELIDPDPVSVCQTDRCLTDDIPSMSYVKQLADDMAWFPKDAGIVEWQRFLPEHSMKLVEAIRHAGNQVVAMITCLKSLQKRFDDVIITVHKYLQQGFPVVMIANTDQHGHEDQDDELRRKLIEIVNITSNDRLRWVIARSSIPPSAGRGRWCAIKVATEILRDIDDSWFVLTDDRRYIDVLTPGDASTCKIPSKVISEYPSIFKDDQILSSITMAQAIRRLVDSEGHSDRALIALGKMGRTWGFGDSGKLPARSERAKTMVFHLENLVQVSMWSRLGAIEFLNSVDSHGQSMLAALSAPIGEDYAMAAMASRAGVIVQGSAIVCNATDSNIGGTKTSIARAWTTPKSEISMLSLRQACLAMCQIRDGDRNDQHPRFDFCSGKCDRRFVIPLFGTVVDYWDLKTINGKKEDGSGFESHYKLMAIGILLGIVRLEWSESGYWVLREDCGRPLPFDDDMLSVQKIWTDFSLHLVNVWCGDKQVELPVDKTGFCALARELRRIQSELQPRQPMNRKRSAGAIDGLTAKRSKQITAQLGELKSDDGEPTDQLNLEWNDLEFLDNRVGLPSRPWMPMDMLYID